jgi:tRNA-2-methylthio-N6-dimethylallyladenosine synthase
MRVAQEARFAVAYTFQYSKRPGTPAAEFADQLDKEIVQERYERLIALVNDVAWRENQTLIGSQAEVLVQNHSRKGEQTQRLAGRSRDNRLVHFDVPEGAEVPRAGEPSHRHHFGCCSVPSAAVLR